MTAIEKGQLVIANRLRDGVVVFLTRSGRWSEAIDDAVLALDPQAAAGLEARARHDETATLVTGAYLVDAERHQGHVRATHIRERMRALGPTVRADLGKQAEGVGAAYAAAEGA